MNGADCHIATTLYLERTAAISFLIAKVVDLRICQVPVGIITGYQAVGSLDRHILKILGSRTREVVLYHEVHHAVGILANA